MDGPQDRPRRAVDLNYVEANTICGKPLQWGAARNGNLHGKTTLMLRRSNVYREAVEFLEYMLV